MAHNKELKRSYKEMLHKLYQFKLTPDSYKTVWPISLEVW